MAFVVFFFTLYWQSFVYLTGDWDYSKFKPRS